MFRRDREGGEAASLSERWGGNSDNMAGDGAWNIAVSWNTFD